MLNVQIHFAMVVDEVADFLAPLGGVRCLHESQPFMVYSGLGIVRITVFVPVPMEM